jgi:hypothetical protein
MRMPVRPSMGATIVVYPRKALALQLRGELIDQRRLGVDGLLSDDVGAEPGVALQVPLRVGELGLVEHLLGDSLVELRLVGGRIDLGQHVAALHVLAFLEVDAQDASIHLRTHRHRVACLGRADAFEVDRHIAELRRRHRDGDGPAAQLRAATGELPLHGREQRGVDDDASHGRHNDQGERPLEQLGHLQSFAGGALGPTIVLHRVLEPLPCGARTESARSVGRPLAVERGCARKPSPGSG